MSSKPVLSAPFLLSVYFDDVLYKLQRDGVGCYIDQYFLRALVYADNIVLVAPTASAMKQMLKICEPFADEFMFVLM